MANLITQDFFHTWDEKGNNTIVFTKSITHIVSKTSDQCIICFIGGSELVVKQSYDDLTYNISLTSRQNNTPLS